MTPKSRLEEIKERVRNSQKSLHYFEHQMLSDLHVLIEELEKRDAKITELNSQWCKSLSETVVVAAQKDKIQSLEAEVARLNCTIIPVHDKCLALEDKLQRQDEMLKVAEDGLSFYGAQVRYEWDSVNGLKGQSLIKDHGRTAQQTLTKIKELRGRDSE